MSVDPNTTYTVRSFNPKVIGEQGVVGDKGPTGNIGDPSPTSYYLHGQNKDQQNLTLTDLWQTYMSRPVSEHGDPDPLTSDPSDVTLITGQYFFIFRGTVRLGSKDAYVGIRVRYNGSVIADTTKHIGFSDLSATEASPYEQYRNIQTQGVFTATDLNHEVSVQFVNESYDGLLGPEDPESVAYVNEGSIQIIRAETVVP